MIRTNNWLLKILSKMKDNANKMDEQNEKQEKNVHQSEMLIKNLQTSIMLKENNARQTNPRGYAYYERTQKQRDKLNKDIQEYNSLSGTSKMVFTLFDNLFTSSTLLSLHTIDNILK